MKVTILAGWDHHVKKGAEPQDGGMVETWTLMLREQGTGNQIHYGIQREARDDLVKQLTGGIVLSGGEPLGFNPPGQ